MVATRISTFNVHQTTLNEASRVQQNLLTLQKQISSGIKASTFGELNGQVEQLSALDNILSKTGQYIENNKLNITRMGTVDESLNKITEIGNDLRDLLLLARSGPFADTMAFEEQLDAIWKAAGSQLNVSFQGRYLFSGTATNIPAVDTETFPSLAVQDTPDDGYYLGSNQDIVVRAEDGFDMTPMPRADDPAFQKLFAAIAIAREAHAAKDDSRLQVAYDMASESLSGVINIQASLGANKLILEKTNDKLASLELYWQGAREEVINTDLVSASTKVAINQGILQAAFQAFARINSLQLSDFLR